MVIRKLITSILEVTKSITVYMKIRDAYRPGRSRAGPGLGRGIKIGSGPSRIQSNSVIFYVFSRGKAPLENIPDSDPYLYNVNRIYIKYI